MKLKKKDKKTFIIYMIKNIKINVNKLNNKNKNKKNLILNKK
jgi:hypothetical protein